jgi:hypothetical protein
LNLNAIIADTAKILAPVIGEDIELVLKHSERSRDSWREIPLAPPITPAF